MSVTWGLDPKSQTISVYFTESTTIYEGMPVCYEFDATTNWLGKSSADLTAESTTTAEGYQNEGKFIRVETPDPDNLAAFAGVVAGSGKSGKTGPCAIDIYVPNGAIVPVRAGCACTVGRTVLGVVSTGTDLDTTGRPVAIAAETVDRSTTEGICLAKLDPDMFLYQTGDAAAVLYDDQNATTTIITNQIYVSESQTAGSFVPLYIHHTSDGTQSAALNEYNILAYLNFSGTYGSDDVVNYCRVILGQCNLSGTIDGDSSNFAGVVGQLSGSPTFTECGNTCALWGDSALTVAPTTGNLELLQLTNNGAATLTSFIRMYGNTAITPGNGGTLYAFDFATCSAAADELNACIINGGDGSAEKGIATTGGWKKIRINVEGTQYWLIAYLTPTEVDMVS